MEGLEIKGEEKRGKSRGLPKIGSHSHVRNPEKYPDCRTDLIGGAATQTFAEDGKDTLAPPLEKRHIIYDTISYFLFRAIVTLQQSRAY